jgi:ribonucleoside-diphosphate reductase alpha chain
MEYIRSSRLRAALLREGIDEICKTEVPETVWRGSRDLVSGYLRGIFSADGSFQGSLEKGVSVRLANKELKLLKDIQLLLLHLGIKSVLYRERRKAGPRQYECAAQHELVISKGSIRRFGESVGFLIGRKEDALWSAIGDYTRGPYKESFFATVDEMVAEGEEEVFDLSEPCTRHFHANGILVHNCGEQPLLPYESCNLGSLNLGAYVSGEGFNWGLYREDIHRAVRFLDNVIDVNSYPIPETAQITRKNRKIGLGVMGFADLLLKMKIPYDSVEAFATGEMLMAFLDREAKLASAALAKKRGAFPAFKGSMWERLGYSKLRNATVSTVAPTGTISMIAGASSGIEPIFSGVFYRNVLDGSRLLDVHPAVAKLLGAQALRPDAITDELVSARLGPAWTPAPRVTVEAHVKMQAMFQRHSDSAVSKTINLPKEATREDVARAYQLAYDLGCKGITVYRDQSRAKQVLERPKRTGVTGPNDDPASCPSC